MIGFIVIHNDLSSNIRLYPSVNPAKFTDNKTKLNLSAVFLKPFLGFKVAQQYHCNTLVCCVIIIMTISVTQLLCYTQVDEYWKSWF